MLAGFENDEAVFFVEGQVTTSSDDPYSDEEQPVYDWVPLNAEWEYVDGEVTYDEEEAAVPVRTQQGTAGSDAELVREQFGEFPSEVYDVYVDPEHVGTVSDGGYSLDISADDRVELGVTDGRFAINPPSVQRLDSQIPEVIHLEVGLI